MKIVCNQQNLYEALSDVSKAVAGKSAIPAIEGIMVTAKNGKLTLTAYDLEIGIITNIDANIKEEGSVVINARLFIDMVRKIDSENVIIETDDSFKVLIKGNIAKFNFSGISPEDFPELPNLNSDESLEIESSKLKEMIDYTLYAIATNDQKPVHTGSKFCLEQGKLTIVSVDGYRLAVCEREVENQSERNFVVPAKTLSEVGRIIGEKEEIVYIGTAKKYGVFKIGEYTVLTRLLEGDFIDYKKTIPAIGKTKIKINVSTLITAVERASLLITDRLKSPIKIKFEDNIAVVTCKTSLGDAYDELNVEIIGDSVEIGFNNRYIIDALRNSKKEELYFEIGTSITPMKVYPVDGNDFLYLVLPVRIKAD